MNRAVVGGRSVRGLLRVRLPWRSSRDALLGLALVVAAGACSYVSVPIPEGAHEGARFLSLASDDLPPCGYVPARLLALGRFPEPRTGELLLEIPAEPLASMFANKNDIHVYRATKALARELGLIAVPNPMRAWRAREGRYDAVELGSLKLPLDELYAMTMETDGCRRAVADACVEKNRCDKANLTDTDFRQYFFGHLPTFAAALDRDVIMVGAGLRRDLMVPVIAVRRSGTSSIAFVLPYEAQRATAARGSDGAIWIYFDDGQLARWHPDTGLTYAPRDPNAEPFGNEVSLIRASETGSSFELYVARHRHWSRFDGYAWKQILRTDRFNFVDIAWISQGEAIALSDVGTSIRYSKGATVTESLQLEAGDSGRVVTQVPGYGTVIGTDNGKLLHLEDGRWVRLDGPQTTFSVFAITPFGEGFLFGQSDTLRQIVPDMRLCDALRSGPGFWRFAPYPGGAAMVYGYNVTFVDLVPKHPECPVRRAR